MFSSTSVIRALLSCASLVVITHGQHQQRINIIHLGDSYSAGNGFDAVNNDGWHGPKWCFRNTNVWGEQTVEIVRASLSSDANMEDDVHIEYSNHACSGCKIQHITQDYTKEKPCAHADGDHQYSSKVTKWSVFGGMQCEHTMTPQIENVNEDTDIVIATMGGNDIDFDTVVKACFISSAIAGGKSCDEATEFALRYVEDGALEAEVILVLDTIAQRMKPGSKIIYNAYPYLASDNQDEESESIREIGTAAAEIGKRAISNLNSMYQASGIGVEIIPFEEHVAVFAGHEPDVWGDPNPNGWLNEMSRDTFSYRQDQLAQLYHPNSLGHGAWASTLAPMLENVVRSIIDDRRVANNSMVPIMGWFSFIGQSEELEKVPIARIDPPTIGLIGEVITFNARDSYDPLEKGIASFHWDFGDGSTSTTSSALVDHVYKFAFTGYIHLRVKTHDGRVADVSQLVVVNKNGDSTLDMCDPDNEEEIVNLGIGVHSYNPMILTIDGEAYECIVHNDDEEWDLVKLSSGRGSEEKKKKKKKTWNH